jgi:hypothetical protein
VTEKRTERHKGGVEEHPLRAELRTIVELKDGPSRFVADMLEWSGRCVTRLEDAERERDRRLPVPDPDVFVEFPKIARLNREVVLTEKLDGTNASVHVSEDGFVRVGSRTRWITPEDDNYGFARWVRDHEAELRDGLGPGKHYGEWWGQGIQRKYGLVEKRFSLFNVHRWADGATTRGYATERPACCHVVPVIGRPRSLMDHDAINAALDQLRQQGSVAAPGFMKPEGVVLYHGASGQLFKVTLEKDEEPKGKLR